jgi:hypothetical protein
MKNTARTTSRAPARSVAQPRKPVAKVDGGAPHQGDRRAPTRERSREAIFSADPGIVEMVTWRKPTRPGGVPVFETNGIICTAET